MAAAALLAALVVPMARARGAADEGAASTKTFDITASKFRFEPETLEVEEGDRVTLTLRSTDVTHGIALKPFRIKTAIPKGGQPVTVEFVAEKAGTFEFRCSEYCGPRHSGMRGRLVVRPRVQ
jgi:cytochrome c oxidase subunit 2